MGLRQIRRRLRDKQRLVRKRFERQRRANLLAASGDHDFVVILDHLKPNYNVGKIFRSADAFGARAVYLVGIRFFDPAPGKGSFKWVPAHFRDTFDQCYNELTKDGYQLFLLDAQQSQSLPETHLPPRSAFVVGHEEFGFSFDPSLYPDIDTVAVPQFGRVHCLNVSVAASIAMYEFTRQRHWSDGKRQ